MLILLILALSLVLAVLVIAMVLYFRHLEHSTEAMEARRDTRAAQERIDRLTEAIAARGDVRLTLPVPPITQLEPSSSYWSSKKRSNISVTVPKEDNNASV